MPTNPYFVPNIAEISPEQYLLEDNIVEAIEINGVDALYIPRESDMDLSSLFGEQPDTRFTSAYPLPVYVISADGFEGPNEIMTKIGLVVGSYTNFTIAAQTFKRFVPPEVRDMPREGDLIFVPLMRRIFEVTFVDNDSHFNALGKYATRPYVYELRAELFKISQERVETGVPDLDQVEALTDYTIQLHLGAGSGDFFIGEAVYQGGNNYVYATAVANVTEWASTTSYLNVINIRGVINTNATIIGVQSGASYNVASYNPFEDHVADDVTNNEIIDAQSNNIILRGETDPRGAI